MENLAADVNRAYSYCDVDLSDGLMVVEAPATYEVGVMALWDTSYVPVCRSGEWNVLLSKHNGISMRVARGNVSGLVFALKTLIHRHTDLIRRIVFGKACCTDQCITGMWKSSLNA